MLLHVQQGRKDRIKISTIESIITRNYNFERRFFQISSAKTKPRPERSTDTCKTFPMDKSGLVPITRSVKVVEGVLFMSDLNNHNTLVYLYI